MVDQSIGINLVVEVCQDCTTARRPTNVVAEVACILECLMCDIIVLLARVYVTHLEYPIALLIGFGYGEY